jgi:catechol 2,3-dioxygenase-like lactoylglutathione lyase family enzyme
MRALLSSIPKPGAAAAISALLVSAAASAAPFPAVNPLQLSPHHVALSVANLHVESAWYARVLGFEEVYCSQPPGPKSCWMWIPGFRIDLLQQKGASRAEERFGGARRGWLHLSLQTPLIRQALQHLRVLGVAVQVFEYGNGHIMRLLFDDPEGNQIELHAYQGGPAITPGYYRW